LSTNFYHNKLFLFFLHFVDFFVDKPFFIVYIGTMKNKKQIKEIIEQEMKEVSDHLDNNRMRSFSFNSIRYNCVKAGLFENANEALFWFSANSKWITKTIKNLNKIYKLP